MAAVGIALVVATFSGAPEDRRLRGRLGRGSRTSRGRGSSRCSSRTAVNLVTFAPPWMVRCPGLRFFQALELTQASTALSMVVPGGPAAGMATSFTMLQRWGFADATSPAR